MKPTVLYSTLFLALACCAMADWQQTAEQWQNYGEQQAQKWQNYGEQQAENWEKNAEDTAANAETAAENTAAKWEAYGNAQSNYWENEGKKWEDYGKAQAEYWTHAGAHVDDNDLFDDEADCVGAYASLMNFTMDFVDVFGADLVMAMEKADPKSDKPIDVKISASAKDLYPLYRVLVDVFNATAS